MEPQVERFENALTFTHLSTLPKRNKDRFVSNFAQEQQHFFKQYLYEGQRVTQSWDNSELTLPPPPASPKNNAQLGFGTPVLRARLDLVSMRPNDPINTGRDRTAGGQGSSKENERPSGHSANLPDTAKRDSKLNAERQKNKISRADKQGLPSSSDDELVGRRADRRQKKRTKRHIMNPEFSRDSDNEDKPSTTCKFHKQTKRQSKLRQEFALMHGFSSTNVGRNRLTLKPGRRDIGVFQKGRASEKTDVIKAGKHKGQESDFCFSEAIFLSKPRQKVSKTDFEKMIKVATTREEASTVSSSASVSVPRSTKARSDSSMIKRKFRDSKAPSRSNQAPKTKPQTQDKAQTGYNPADSIVWDIEQAELLGSEVSSGMKQGTIVLKVAHLPLTSNEVLENQALDTNVTALEAQVKLSQQRSLSVTQSDSFPSPSLGPSQSASQIGLRTVDVASRPTTLSKYFKPLPPGLMEPHLVLHDTVNQHDTKSSALSELGELSIIEDAIPQLPEPASRLHYSAGLSTRSYCDGQESGPGLVPLLQPNNLEVTAYFDGYPDSGLWSTVDYPGDLSVEHLNNTDIVDYVSVNFDGETNPSFVFTANDEVWTLDYNLNVYSELGEMDQIHDTSSIPLSGQQSTDLRNSFTPSMELSDAYSDISERCQAMAYQHSGGDRSSINPGSDQQMQPDGDFNLEHEGVSSMDLDLDLYPDVVHHFWQGRSLLYGLDTPGDSSSLHKLSNVEADVARQLQLDHWQWRR